MIGYKSTASNEIEELIEEQQVATPPVVVTTSGVTLAERMRLSELPLATTPGGKVFALKALHPSEHTIKSTRVPGGNTMSVSLNCDMVSTIKLTEANARTNIFVSPNIVVPCAYEVLRENDGYGSRITSGNFYNAAFGGSLVVNPKWTDTNAITNAIAERISGYRITSQSVTVELIAPSLTDQGTITAAQYVLPPKTVEWGGPPNVEEDYEFGPDGYCYPEPVRPSQALLGTSAYTSAAREGVYMPLKLTDFDYKSTTDRAIISSKSYNFLAATPVFNIVVSDMLYFPYVEDRTTATEFHYAIPKLCGDNFGVISVEGTAANVSLRIRVRQVVEVTSLPGGAFAPMMEAPLPPDPVSMRMYMEISGRMKDGYPASWNHVGKLKEIVLNIGKQLLPYVEPALSVLSELPGPVGAVAKGAGTVVKTVKAIRKARKKKKAKEADKAGAPKQGRMKLSDLRP